MDKMKLVMVGNGMAGVRTIEELLKIAPDRSITGSFYNSDILAGRAGTAQGRQCVAFRTTDGQSLYHSSACLTDGKMVGAEALIRWRDAELGDISPAEFVPIAEESGLILPLGEQVLRMTFTETAQWQSAAIAINVSAVQLRRKGFASQVLRIAAAAGIDPRRYEIEVTETALLGEDPVTVGNVAALKRIGFQISLDDFGTGFSSLSVLQRFKVDKIKIDCSFVAALGSGRDADTLIDAIIQLGRALDLSVVAEGVENESQWSHLVDAGCHLFQGYLLGRPEPAPEPAPKQLVDKGAEVTPVAQSRRRPRAAGARRLRTSPS